jgi:transcriptional regulator with XRE-family HTH domain
MVTVCAFDRHHHCLRSTEARVGHIGRRLRELRLRWGLSLKDVEERTTMLARGWGSDSYQISGSFLARVEQGKHEMTVPKLIALSTVYCEPAEQLLCEFLPKLLHREKDVAIRSADLIKPQLVSTRQFQKNNHHRILENYRYTPIPENTILLPMERDRASSPYRKAVIGRRDSGLVPMIRAGSIVKIDIRKKAIVREKDWNHEFDRPIYLLMTRHGLTCGWCETDANGMLTVLTHSKSGEPGLRWKRNDFDVIGRAVAVLLRLAA